MLGFSFRFSLLRFRGKTKRLLTLYHCFLDHPGVGLHPIQISKFTGMRFPEVITRLDNTNELFVKLPKRKDGLTRYRLTSSTAAQSKEAVEKMILSAEKKENVTLYSLGLIILSIFAMGLIMIFPYETLGN